MIDHLGIAVREARALWRRDAALLWPVAALFVFLPQIALLLLVPPVPAVDAAATVETWSKALEPWIERYGGWYVLATLVGQYGVLAIVSLYMAPVPAVGGALTRAGLRFPRAMLASLVVTIPCACIALISLSLPFLPVVAIPAIVWVLARTALANPAILAESGTGAVMAVVRSWRLTQGRSLAVAILFGAILLGGQVLGATVVAIDRGIRASALANPVLLTMIDGVAALVTAVAALALALMQVVLYRRLAR